MTYRPDELVNVGQLLYGDVIAARSSKRELTYFAHTRLIVRGKNDRYVKDPVSFVNLAHNFPSAGGPNNIENLEWIKAPAGNVVIS
jgi:hypothetical protein